MKILQINALFGNKSTGNIVKDIHTLLREEGFESRVVSVSASEASEGVVALGYGLESKLHAVMSRIDGAQGFYSKRGTRKLVRALALDKPDIIHIHNLHSNFINLPILFDFASRNKIPVMMTFHDAWYFTGKCYHFLDIGCDRWKTECHGCPKKKKDIPSLIDSSRRIFRKKKKLYSSVDLHVVGCSKWITECAKESPLLSGAKFYQIYNGVDKEIFNPNAPEIREELMIGGEFLILTMANKWFDPKNAEVRDEVLSLLSEMSARLLIVGCTPHQMAEYGDNKSVTCLGYVSDREYMARLYRSADVFLNLTLVDTLPTVNIESAMCSSPIVTYDAGGSAELVSDGVTGYVVRPLDKDGVISALRNIADGRIDRAACHEFATERFEKTVNYRKYVDLYTKIYESKGNTNG